MSARGQAGHRERGRREGRAGGAPFLGRAHLLGEIHRYLERGHSVLLVGPRDVGKSALIAALDWREGLVLDPFMGVAPRLAGRIRLVMDRGVPCVAATRTLDRGAMGAVRRLAFRFTTIRVLPLSAHWMRLLIEEACARERLRAPAREEGWIAEAVHLSGGLPGLALALVRAAAAEQERSGHVPSPRAAYVAARIAGVELSTAHDGFGHRPPMLHGVDDASLDRRPRRD